jgi:integrase
MNSRLDNYMVKVINTLAELEREDRATSDSLSAMLKKEANGTYFHQYADDVIQSLHDANRYHHAKKTRVAVNKFMEFRRGRMTPLHEMTFDTLDKFITWLRLEKKSKPNTISKDIECVRRVLKQAEKDQLIKSVPDGLDAKRERTTKDKLHPDQIQLIEALDLEQGSYLWHTRNYFLASYYYAGIRWGDLCTLQWGNIKNGRLHYTMRKTGKKFGAPFRVPEALSRILDYYRRDDQAPEDFIFPILPTGRDYTDANFLQKQIGSKNAITNQRLKQIATLAGIEKNVSMHVARHSAAYRMLLEGVDIYTISKALEHENVSITETYLRGIDDTLIVNAMERVFADKQPLT